MLKGILRNAAAGLLAVLLYLPCSVGASEEGGAEITLTFDPAGGTYLLGETVHVTANILVEAPEMPAMCCWDAEDQPVDPEMSEEVIYSGDVYQGPEGEWLLDTWSGSGEADDKTVSADWYAAWDCPDVEVIFPGEYTPTATMLEPYYFTVTDARIESITFDSDHGVMTDNSTDWETSGSLYPEPEYSFPETGGDTLHPITHSKNKNVDITVTVKIFPEDAAEKSYELSTSAQAEGSLPKGFSFSGTHALAGGAHNISMQSSDLLEDKIYTTAPSASWHLKAGDADRVLLSNGGAPVFVTWGTPEVESGGKITHKRIEWVVSTADGESDPDVCARALFDALPNDRFAQTGTAQGPDNIWDLMEGGTSQCPGLARFVEANFGMLGLDFGRRRYCRATPEGGYEAINTAEQGPTRVIAETAGHPHGEDTAHDDYGAIERLLLGTAPDGLNHYEAAVRFNNKYYCLSFGVFDTPKDVVKNVFDNEIHWYYGGNPAGKPVKCTERPWVESE